MIFFAENNIILNMVYSLFSHISAQIDLDTDPDA